MKLWTWETCDRKFVALFRRRFEGEKCMDCGRRYWTDVAHWFRRSIWGTRWMASNVLLLCRKCHSKYDAEAVKIDGVKLLLAKAEQKRREAMRPLMVKIFGEDLIAETEARANTLTKRTKAIQDFMNTLGALRA